MLHVLSNFKLMDTSRTAWGRLSELSHFYEELGLSSETVESKARSIPLEAWSNQVDSWGPSAASGKHETSVSLSTGKVVTGSRRIPQIGATVSLEAGVIQIWEGTIDEVDHSNEVMRVHLSSKTGAVDDHTAEIELKWVADQDRELLSPGAVFYLTLFQRVKPSGTIENSQEIRFRRRPNWSSSQIESIARRASSLSTKFKSRPLAE